MGIYLDNSATTKPYQEVVDSMVKALTEDYENPSAAHRMGMKIEKNIKDIRRNIAKTLGAKEKEIVFTSGGTECNNSIIRSCANLNKQRGKHIISTSIEHPSVLNTLEDLEKDGFEVTYLPVNSEGKISIEDVEKSLREDTILVSIMFVNNEVGSIQPIKEIGNLLKNRKNKVFFHVDAVQGYGKVEFRPSRYNIDFMSVSAHKIHGPKGIGFMYMKDGNNFKPLVTGGGQESNLRSGTENVPGIYGMGAAVSKLFSDLNGSIEKMNSLKNVLKEEILKNIEGVKINSPEDGVCHILNVSFEDVRGEVLLHYLEQKEVYVSTGSACSSKKKGSHVLNAMGLTSDEIEGAIRFSLSDMNTEEEIVKAVEILKDSVEDLRKIIRIRK